MSWFWLALAFVHMLFLQDTASGLACIVMSKLCEMEKQKTVEDV